MDIWKGQLVKARRKKTCGLLGRLGGKAVEIR